MKIKAHIENNDHGLYSVYIEEDLPFGLIGEGRTAEEAKADFLKVYEAQRAYHLEETGEDIKIDFSFTMDISALLYTYKNVLTLAGLSRLTGINKAQLSQYVCGTRHPSSKTEAKIKTGVQNFANELLNAFA